jgi:hypothetical protein
MRARKTGPKRHILVDYAWPSPVVLSRLYATRRMTAYGAQRNHLTQKRTSAHLAKTGIRATAILQQSLPRSCHRYPTIRPPQVGGNRLRQLRHEPALGHQDEAEYRVETRGLI